MLEIIREVAAAGLLLMLLEGLDPRLRRRLPLGGSHLAQLGLLFAATIFILESIEGARAAIAVLSGH